MKNILKKLTPSRIASKLSLIVSALFIVMFVPFEVYKFLNTKSEITHKINIEQYSQAKFIAKDIKEKIGKRIQFIDGLADIISPQIIQSENQLVATLKAYLKITNMFPLGFAVIRPNGKGLIAEYPILAGRKNASRTDIEWFIQAKKSNNIVISAPFISTVNGELLIAVAKSIRDENGKVLAILAAPIFLNSSGFIDYVFDESYKQEGDILVISRDDELFVAASDPAYLLKSTPALGANKHHDAAMNGLNGYEQFTDGDGNTMLTAIADVNGPDWFVIVRTPIDMAYKSLHDSLYTTIISSVIATIMILLTITFTQFLFFTPLRKAAKSVKGMVEKKQSLTQIKIYKNDEIGELISGFNLLIDMLNKRNNKLKKTNVVLESLSQTDGLTGAANRRYFDLKINHIWREHISNQLPLTLLLIDIDHFKKYNDTYGHIAGDNCLKTVSKAIQNIINQPVEFFARYGGEEFVILLQGSESEGVAIAKKVQLIVNNSQIENKGCLAKRLTVSLGVASIIPQPNSDAVELIKIADQALYQSKANGRNCYKVYERKGFPNIMLK